MLIKEGNSQDACALAPPEMLLSSRLYFVHQSGLLHEHHFQFFTVNFSIVVHIPLIQYHTFEELQIFLVVVLLQARRGKGAAVRREEVK